MRPEIEACRPVEQLRQWPVGAEPVCSVLFCCRRHRPDLVEQQPAYFRDLNLDQVVAMLTSGREEYDLAPYFYTRLRAAHAVSYRQEVLADLDRQPLQAAVAGFASAMRRVRLQLWHATGLRYERERQCWRVQAARTYTEAVTSLAGDLDRAGPASAGLRAFRDYLAGYLASEGFTNLVADTVRMLDRLATVGYRLHILGLSITVSLDGEEDGGDYSTRVAATFERFRQGAVDSHRMRFLDPVGLNHVEAGVLDRVVRLYPDVFSDLARYCDRHAGFLDHTVTTFDRQVQFYLAYLDHVAPLRQAGLPFCYPEVDLSKQVSLRDTFDLPLAGKLVAAGKEVVVNDLHLSGRERFLVVTGANQGGKTTLARTFGQVHHLAGIGCLVPGREAKLHLCDQLFTHFPRAEKLADLRGRLQDDLLRMRDILRRATGDSVVITNELFGSTALADATLLGTRILQHMIDRDLLGVYVTFVDELSRLGEATVSMVATVAADDPAVRTFKVVRQPADGLAHALAIAEKYQLTRELIEKRFAS